MIGYESGIDVESMRMLDKLERQIGRVNGLAHVIDNDGNPKAMIR